MPFGKAESQVHTILFDLAHRESDLRLNVSFRSWPKRVFCRANLHTQITLRGVSTLGPDAVLPQFAPESFWGRSSLDCLALWHCHWPRPSCTTCTPERSLAEHLCLRGT